MTKYSDQSYNIRIELDTENCELGTGDLDRLEQFLSPLREPVKDFPVTDLYITIQYHPASNDYRVKTVLQLPGKGLATGDVDEELYPALRRCVRKLVHKVVAYKERMGNAEAIAKQEKGTHKDVVAQRQVDSEAIEQAVQHGNYAEFRVLTYPYEEPLRKRIGRWIQRYARVESQLGDRFDLADMVEEVFLNAFERFDDRPREVPFGDWLENLIDPSIKMLSKETDEELSNIEFARTSVEAARDRQRGSK